MTIQKYGNAKIAVKIVYGTFNIIKNILFQLYLRDTVQVNRCTFPEDYDIFCCKKQIFKLQSAIFTHNDIFREKYIIFDSITDITECMLIEKIMSLINIDCDFCRGGFRTKDRASYEYLLTKN